MMQNGKKRSYASASAKTDKPVRSAKRLKHNENDNECNVIDLGLEYPSLPRVLNSIKTEETLKLDSSFDLVQFAKSESMPFIFDWSNLTTAMHPIKLRREALKKQERSKYVKRDSMSNEQAADRRRRQNRESAKRTRERVRKYIAVLEMYYAHVHNVNALLIKQLEVMAKYCSDKLSKEDMQNLKVMIYECLCLYIFFCIVYKMQTTTKQRHEWPQAPTIEQCINAKPASISAISSPVKTIESTQSTGLLKEKQRKTECSKKFDMQSQSEDASTNCSLPLMPSLNDLNPLTLPPLNISNARSPPRNKSSAPSIGDPDHLERIIQQLQSMQNQNRKVQPQPVNNMNSNNIINVLQQIYQPKQQTQQIFLSPMHTTTNTANILALNAQINPFHHSMQTMQQFPNMSIPNLNQNLISLPNNLVPVQLNMMMMNREQSTIQLQ